MRRRRPRAAFRPREGGSAGPARFPAAGVRRSGCEMEGRAAAAGGDPDGPRERRGPGDTARPQQNHQARPQPAVDRLPKQSYWLDLWLFVLVDLVLFLFVYLWP